MVTILLATLNGEDYLKAQLESIAAQTYENWQLVVGDDGSTDGTISILEEFSKQYPEQVTIIKNDPPQGSAKDNFISLIQNSYGPYFMFCDQDDVWKPDKIYLTLQKMEALEARYGEKTPILVHSDLSVADHNLEMVAESFFQYANIPKRIVLNQLMVQNYFPEILPSFITRFQLFCFEKLYPTIWIAANNIAHNILTIFSNLLFVFFIPKFNSHCFLFYLFPSDTLKNKSAFFFFLP